MTKEYAQLAEDLKAGRRVTTSSWVGSSPMEYEVLSVDIKKGLILCRAVDDSGDVFLSLSQCTCLLVE